MKNEELKWKVEENGKKKDAKIIAEHDEKNGGCREDHSCLTSKDCFHKDSLRNREGWTKCGSSTQNHDLPAFR
jgi:hypothetical protein